ncbi:transposase [Streptomyces sp. NPDC001667]
MSVFRRSSGRTPSRSIVPRPGKRTYAAVASDLGITAESLRTWVRKDEAEAAPGRRDPATNEAEELARLRTKERGAAEGGEGVAAGARGPASGSRLFRPGSGVKPRRWDFISGHRGCCVFVRW